MKANAKWSIAAAAGAVLAGGIGYLLRKLHKGQVYPLPFSIDSVNGESTSEGGFAGGQENPDRSPSRKTT